MSYRPARAHRRPGVGDQIVIASELAGSHTWAVPIRVRTVALVAAALVAMTLGACTPSHNRAVRTNTPSATGLASTSTTGPTSTPSSSSTTAVRLGYRARFMARPLHLPTLHLGQACPTSKASVFNTAAFGGVVHGSGPVHPLLVDYAAGPVASGTVGLTSSTQYPGWLTVKTLWFSEPPYQGPFVVRVRRLDGAGPIGLLDDPTATSFYVPAGPTLNSTGGYREMPGVTWVKTPGCLAWQVDGLTFSHVIIARAVCRPPGCTIPHTRASTAQAAEAEHLRWFIGAYDAGDIRTALAQFSPGQNVSFSDCDYARQQVVDGHGRAQLTAWLRRNIALHDRLAVDTIVDANPDQPIGVLGVRFSRRSNDAITRAGHPNGITPAVAAKVKFDDAGRITAFGNGPYGGPASSCKVG